MLSFGTPIDAHVTRQNVLSPEAAFLSNAGIIAFERPRQSVREQCHGCTSSIVEVKEILIRYYILVLCTCIFMLPHSHYKNAISLSYVLY